MRSHNETSEPAIDTPGHRPYVSFPAPAGIPHGKEVKQQMSLIPALISFLHLDSDEEGQGLAEYALILALIAIVAIIALIFLGGQVSKILSNVGNSV